MGFSIAHVIAAVLDTFTPSVVVEFAIELHIRASQANLLAVDAGEICFAADSGAEADIKCVIPDIEFPNVRRISHGKEIDSRHRLAFRSRDFVRYVDDILIGANPAERG